MRKRQWKKILSVVLALAMVFSMNVSAFADEVTDPVAVEEPAAEEPVAEAPVESNEETPNEEKTEEPAAAEEAAPAESEEAAGGSPLTLDTGWATTIEDDTAEWDGSTLTISGDVGGKEITAGAIEDTLTVEAAEGATGNVTLTTCAAENNNTITVGTLTLEVGKTYTLYKYASSGTLADVMSFAESDKAGKITVFDGIEVYKADGTEKIEGDLTANTAYLFAGALTVSTCTAGNWTKDDAPTSKAALAVDASGIKLSSGVNGNEYYVSTTSTAPERNAEVTGTFSGTTATVLPEESGKYYAWTRTAKTADSKFASDWLATDPASVDVTVEEMTGTVSGMTFTPAADSTWSRGTSDNTGIYTVNILTGTVEISPETTLGNIKAVSINVVQDATLLVDSSINARVPVTIKGAGTAVFEAPSIYEGIQTGVSISGSNAGRALVAVNENGNNVEWTIVEDGVDAAAKTIGGEIAIVSTTATNDSTTAIDFDTEEITAPFVLSENKTDWIAPTYKANTLKVSDNAYTGVSVKFGSGKLLIGTDTNHDDAADTFDSFVVVPARAAYKFPAGLVDGQQTANGVDLTRGSVIQAGMKDDYEFILSSNGSATQADTLAWTGTWQDGFSNDEIKNVANTGAIGEAGKTYYLYARKKATSPEEFRSEAKPVGQFTTLKKTSISINKASGKAVSPNYAGDVDDLSTEEALAFFEKQSDKVLNSSFFTWTFNYPSATEVPGIHVTENIDEYDTDAEKVLAYKDNVLYVRDGDGFKIGKITLDIEEKPAANSWPVFTGTSVGALYSLEPNTYGYGVRIKFDSEGTAGAAYDAMAYGAEGNISKVSFNVLPAPVKYEPVVVTPTISGYVKEVGNPAFKATNQITGAKLAVGTVFSTQAPDYFIDGKKADAESWNNLPAGTYKITLSAGNLSNDDYYTEYKNDNTDYSTEATLKVVAKDGLGVVGSLKDNAEPVRYGTTIEFVKNQIQGIFTLDGETVVDSDGNKIGPTADKLVFLASPSDNLATATLLTNDTIKTVSAGQTIYAYYKDAVYGGKTVSSDAIKIPVEKRPIKLSYTGAAIASDRGAKELIDHVSTNDVKGTAQGADYNIDTAPYTKGNEKINGSDLMGSNYKVDVPIDTSRINKNKANTYEASLAVTDSMLSSNFTENYTIDPASTVDYKINGIYYIKYILEYNGKKWVSSNVVKEADLVDTDLDGEGDSIKLQPSKIKSVSWGSVDGKDEGVLGKDNLITDWKYYKEDSTAGTRIGSYDGTDNVTPADYVVYAIVTAVATKNGDASNVMVESITPVEYDGTQHVVDLDEKGNKHGDLELTIYDEATRVSIENGVANDNYMNDPADPNFKKYWTEIVGKGLTRIVDRGAGEKDEFVYYLEQKKDYTVSYKNNTNASVAYDPTVSGDGAGAGKDGADSTFKQLFPEKKRPQVIVKGKGNYNKMKVVVYFDILPTNIAAGRRGLDGIKAFYEPNKTLKVTAKPYKYIFSNYEKAEHDIDSNKGTKKYVLKEGKYNANKATYTKDFVKEIYRVTYVDNDPAKAEIKRELVTNFKRIPAGEYLVVIKGVNNYYNTVERKISVKTAYLLEKQTFKFTKKKNWSKTPLTIADFKVTAKDKKKKTPIEILSAKEGAANKKAGIYIYAIEKKVGKGKNDFDPVVMYNADEIDNFKFKDAGVYRVWYVANGELGKSNSIQGDKAIQIEVKGKKVKASDFKINDGKKLEYTGKDTKITVALKKPSKFPVDEYSKIPLGNTAKKINVGIGEDDEDAIDVYDWKYGNAEYSTSFVNRRDDGWLDDDGYTDQGAKLVGNLVKSYVYSVSYVPDNADMDYTYSIYIKPSGQYYAEEGYDDGLIRLSYKYDVINLKKAGKTGSAVKILMDKEEANIGGTSPWSMKFCISGDSFDGGTVSADSGLKYYRLTDSDGKKGQITIWDSEHTNEYKINVTYKNNKKTGTAKATFKAADKKSAAVFKGSVTVPYSIVDKKVDEIVSYNAKALVPDQVVADITDAVEPAGNKKPAPIVKLYQVDETGSKVVALKNKKDFAWAVGKTVSGTGIEIDTTAPAAGSFAFVDKDHKDSGATLVAGTFNTYGKKAKKVKASLSQGSGSGYDTVQKGYIYTGEEIKPGVTQLVYGDKDLKFPAGITESSNFVVKYNNNVKVGTATATITLKKDSTPGISANAAYPWGGSVTVKYKIVPQTNQNLILNE